MSNYITNSTFNTLVNTVTSLSGILYNELLSFQTISSYYLLKTDAQNIYQTIKNMSGYLTTGNASTIYQPIKNMQYYLTILNASVTYQTISGMYLYQKVSDMVNYQPKNNYVLSQDIVQYLTISSAIYTYQPKFNLNDYLTVSNANILFNSNVTISSSINSLNQYIINN